MYTSNFDIKLFPRISELYSGPPHSPCTVLLTMLIGSRLALVIQCVVPN